jgi:hypothetical protein
MVPLGIMGIIYIPETLFIKGDINATISNIIENKTLFRFAILSALAVQLNNIILVLCLYKLLAHVNKVQASLMVIFSFMAVPIAMLNELNHFAVLELLGDSKYLLNFTKDQVQGLVGLFLELHHYGIVIATLFWGLWLFPMGYLIYKSGFIPKFLGVLLMIACMGYLVDFITLIIRPDIDFTLSEFTFLGEVLFPLWLVIKGIKKPLKTTK